MTSGNEPDARVDSPLVRSTIVGGAFELLRLLGEGGMGVVWLARERTLGREVAVKLMHPCEDATRLRRFEREARALASLDHPSILPVLYAGADESTGTPFIVTRAILLSRDEIFRLCRDVFHCPFPRKWSVAGPLGEPSGDPVERSSDSSGPAASGSECAAPLSLADLLEGDKQLPEAAVLRIARDLAGALSAAHAAGILHRDLKPSNILFDASGRAILSDFGLAKFTAATGTAAGSTGAGAGAAGGSGDVPRPFPESEPSRGDGSLSLDESGRRKFLGSPAYAAPEQFRDGASLTPAIDWYAFGAVLHEALTGERPHALRPLSSYAPGYISRAWDPFLRDLLEQDPARRLSDPAAILRAMDRIARHPARPSLRRRIATALGAAAAIGAILLAAARFRNPAPPGPAEAKEAPGKAMAPAMSGSPVANESSAEEGYVGLAKSPDIAEYPAPSPADPMPLRLPKLWLGDNRGMIQLLNTVRMPAVDDLVAQAFEAADPEVRRLMDEGNAAWTASPRDDKTAHDAWLEVVRRLTSAIDQALSAAAKSGDPADAPSPALRVQYAVVTARIAWTYLAQSSLPQYEVYSDALRLIEPLVEADPRRYAPLRSWLLAEFAFAKGMEGHFNDAALLLQEACATLDLYTMRSWPGCARQEAFLLASIGSMRYAGGQSDSALVETHRAIALAEQIAGGSPDDAMASFLAGCHYRAGECLANMDRRQEAIEEYEQAIALWKPLGEAFVLTCTQVLGRIASCYSKLDMPDRAVELLDSVIETLLPFADREPGRYQNMIARLLRNRAMEYRKLGDIAAAEADEAAAAARLDLELQ